MASHELLDINIDSYSLPDYWSAGSGQVTVTVDAKGDDLIGKPGYVNLYLSTDGTLDGRSEFKVANKWISSFEDSETYTLDFIQYVEDGDNPRDIAITPGRYYLVASAVGGSDGFNLGTEMPFRATDSKAVSAPDTDVIIDWLSTFLTSTQLEGSKGNPDAPYNGARIVAMMSASAYDIVSANPSEGRDIYNISSGLFLEKPLNFSAEAAINKAAHYIFSDQFGAQDTLFDEQYDLSKAEISDGGVSDAVIIASEEFGEKVAKEMLTAREDDGTDDNTPFPWPTEGDTFSWRPHPYNGNGTVGGPNRGDIKPFILPDIKDLHSYSAINNQDNLLITGKDGEIDLRLNYKPTDGDGTRYTREYETARVYGVENETPLTQVAWDADQRAIGEWYSQDEEDSWQPWGLPNYMAMAIAVSEGNTLEQNAQLFATLHSAMADGVTSAWHSKFKGVIPRPAQVVNDFAFNDNANDAQSNSDDHQVVYDPLWRTGLDNIIQGQISPPFPDYVSGHSGMYGAWSSVMEAYFGDDYDFSAGSQTLEGHMRDFDGYEDPITGAQRSSFKEVAMECAASRLYWGSHTPSATGASFITGQNIGNYAISNEIFGKPLTNAGFDGIPNWAPFATEYTANPILPLVEIDDPILGPSPFFS